MTAFSGGRPSSKFGLTHFVAGGDESSYAADKAERFGKAIFHCGAGVAGNVNGGDFHDDHSQGVIGSWRVFRRL